MIYGKAKLEFGCGDIKLTALSNGLRGILALKTESGHYVGEKHKVDSSFKADDSDVMIVFNNIEGLDVLISELTNVRELMLNPSVGIPMDTNVDVESFLQQ